MRRWGTRALVAGVAAAAVVAGSTAASAATADTWTFGEVAPGDPVPPSQAFLGDVPLYAATTTTLRAVAHGDGTALDFAAWRSLPAKAKVNKFASELSSDESFQTDPYWGVDGGDDSFDPGTGDFSVSVWLQPTPAPDFPRGGLSPDKVSPNVLQKGRANAPGGYWKVYLQMVKVGTTLQWAPVCVLKGGDGRSANVGKRAQVLPIDNGVGVTVTCARTAGILTLTVTPDGGDPQVRTRNASTIDVANNEALSVGHKPGATNASDVYDGLLADLSVSMG